MYEKTPESGWVFPVILLERFGGWWKKKGKRLCRSLRKKEVFFLPEKPIFAPLQKN